jgi:exodeoxyribonuclease VII large subunit
VVPNRVELLEAVRAWEGQLHGAVAQRLEWARRRLDDLAGRRAFRLPLERVRDLEQSLDDWAERLGRAARQQAVRGRQRLEAGAARLEALSPLNVLSRGYSLTRREADQVVVRSPEQVVPGDRLVTTMARGRIVSRVEAVNPDAS